MSVGYIILMFLRLSSYICAFPLIYSEFLYELLHAEELL